MMMSYPDASAVVAVNSTGSPLSVAPSTVAVSRLMPAEPNRQAPTRATPSAPVVWVSPVTEPLAVPT